MRRPLLPHEGPKQRVGVQVRSDPTYSRGFMNAPFLVSKTCYTRQMVALKALCVVPVLLTLILFHPSALQGPQRMNSYPVLLFTKTDFDSIWV
jgi:hypothetical protein